MGRVHPPEQRVPELIRRRPGRDLNEWTNSLIAGVLGGGAVLIGLLLLAGTGGPTNTLMRGIAPLKVWAAAFVTAGLIGLAGQAVRRVGLIRAGHLIGAALAAAVAAAFYVAATARENTASLHGAGVYLTIAALHLLVAVFSRPPR